MLIQYKRKAYISDVEEYARVTFDIRLRSMKQTGYDPLPYETAMQYSDVETLFDRDACVILELKCYTSYVPLWMIDCIRTFQLQRRGFSKYMMGIRQNLTHYSGFDPAVKTMLYDDQPDEL